MGRVLVGFEASVFVETSQAMFLAERYASVLDVLANTLGAGIGAAAYFVVHGYLQRRAAQSARENSQARNGQ